MKTLLLLRHAKSSWDDGRLDDFDRPLNERGQRAAAVMGVFLAQDELVPDVVLCSAARRTRQTLDLVLRELPGASPQVTFHEDLYLASPGAMLDCVTSAPDTAEIVLLVAHSPGVGQLAQALSRSSAPAAADSLARGVPTAGLAEIDFGVEHWRDVAPTTGHLRRFTRPKDLL